MKGRVAAVARDRRADVLDRVLQAAELVLDQAEQMQRLRLTGVNRQDLAADPFGLGGSARTLMRERYAERSGDRWRLAAPAAVWAARPALCTALLSVHRLLIAHPLNTYPRGCAAAEFSKRGVAPLGWAERTAERGEEKPMAEVLLLPLRIWLRLAGLLLVLLAPGCAAPRPSTQIPVPPGQARIWVYRNWLPSESLNLANIAVNGTYFGSVENGGVFYRDVPPGTYHIVPESWAHDPKQQDTNVTLVAGQQAFIKIVDLTSWAVSVSASKNFERDAFWAWLVPAQAAQREIAFDRNGI
jgi:hypothetical protein